MTAPTMWAPPPDPVRDLWHEALRIAAPATGDHTARHQRGRVRLPYDLGPSSGGMAGELVESWVCCDPACGGVELGEHVLEINHGCCVGLVGACHARSGRHHGPFTAFWEPDGGVQ